MCDKTFNIWTLSEKTSNKEVWVWYSIVKVKPWAGLFYAGHKTGNCTICFCKVPKCRLGLAIDRKTAHVSVLT